MAKWKTFESFFSEISSVIQKCIFLETDSNKSFDFLLNLMGAQWLSGRVLDSRPEGRGLEPHRRHCVVVLEQDTFILAYYWSTQEDPSLYN